MTNPTVILHVPHDSVVIPPEVRGQFLLGDAELQAELRRMTDHFTHTLFCAGHGRGVPRHVVVAAPAARTAAPISA